MTNPHQRYPIYVPTKGRYNYLYTIRNLQKMNALFYAIVEEQEYELYAQKVDKKNLLVLDNSFKKAYQTLDNRGGSISYGSGPARNFAWQHAKDSKAPWHWVMDDNIRTFRIHDNNRKLRIYNTSFFRVMEQFVERTPISLWRDLNTRASFHGKAGEICSSSIREYSPAT